MPPLMKARLRYADAATAVKGDSPGACGAYVVTLDSAAGEVEAQLIDLKRKK